MWSQCHIIHKTKCVLVLYIHKEGDTTPPCGLRTTLLLPCILRKAIFGVAYCVPFKNKIKQFWHLHLQYEHVHSFLKLDVFAG